MHKQLYVLQKIVSQLYVSQQLQDARDGDDCDRLRSYIDCHCPQIDPNQLGLCIDEYIVKLIAISLDRVSIDVEGGFWRWVRHRTTSQQTSTAFLAGKKTLSFFPATTEQNIARFNLFREPSISFYLMAIVAIVAIHQECIIPLVLFNWSVVTY
jgi:hypothetical protein